MRGAWWLVAAYLFVEAILALVVAVERAADGVLSILPWGACAIFVWGTAFAIGRAHR